jgi:hypothetical protein
MIKKFENITVFPTFRTMQFFLLGRLYSAVDILWISLSLHVFSPTGLDLIQVRQGCQGVTVAPSSCPCHPVLGSGPRTEQHSLHLNAGHCWQEAALTLSMKYRATALCRTFISLDFQSSRYWFRILSTHFFSRRAVSYFCQSFSPWKDPTPKVDCLGVSGAWQPLKSQVQNSEPEQEVELKQNWKR